jgi:membrane protein
MISLYNKKKRKKDMVKMKRIKELCLHIQKKSHKDSLGSRAAGLAFYMIFALIPLLTIFLTVTAFVLRGQSTQTQVINFLTNKIGNQGAVFLQSILSSISHIQINALTSIVVIVIVLYAATNLFLHLQKTFASIFQLHNTNEGLIKKTIKSRLLAISYLVVLFSLLFLLMFLNVLSSVFFDAAHLLFGAIIPNY